MTAAVEIRTTPTAAPRAVSVVSPYPEPRWYPGANLFPGAVASDAGFVTSESGVAAAHATSAGRAVPTMTGGA